MLMPTPSPRMMFMREKNTLRKKLVEAFSRTTLCANTGMKAELNAPSPHRRLNRLGMANAMRNADACKLDPKAAKKAASRTNPKIREQNVPVIIFRMGCIDRQGILINLEAFSVFSRKSVEEF